MQALYHQLTGKKEVVFKAYNDDYIIRIDEIRDLVVRLEQTLQQYNFKATDIRFTVFHYDRDRLTNTSLERFLQYDENRKDPVKSVEIDVNFLLDATRTGRYQSYTISLQLESFVLAKSELIPRRGIGAYHEGTSAVQLKVEYVDYVVARSFISTVEEWVESLSKVPIRRMPDWLVNIVSEYGSLGANVFAASCAFAILLLTGNAHHNLDTINILVISTIFFTFRFLGQLISDAADSRLAIYWKFPFIIFNKGDERNYDVFLKRRQKATKIATAILAGFLLPILLNLIASAAWLWMSG